MQELEKILEEIEAEHPYKVPGNYESYSQYNEAWRDAIDRVRVKLEKFFKEKENAGWIPVEERMPEEYGEYLVTIVPSAGYLWAKRIIANFSDLMGIVKKPIFYTGEVGKIDFEDITDMVIAWRPLPDPYQTERRR